MSVWHVTNHKLYSGAGTSDPVFIVGTEFGFGWDNGGTNWTGADQKSNRALAGNTVRMWGNDFGDSNAASGAFRLLSCFSQNPDIDYFIPDMNLFDYFTDADHPRGQHSYVTNQLNYVTNGHWIKQPSISDGNNSASTDGSYINGHGGDPSYWHQTENYGNKDWHTAWLSCLKTGTVNGTNFYDRLATWELMDEPFHPGVHRDAESNQISVSGHHSFCETAEGADVRPKMVGTVASTNADSQYTSMSGAMGIVGGNAYGGAASTLWWTPNLVAWAYSKISNESEKMIIPWLWGRYSDITYSKYVFYGSLIEGARGVIWWMKTNDLPQTPDYSNYAHQREIYAYFTSNASFSNQPLTPDSNIFLSGTELVLDNLTVTNGYTEDPNYPLAITKRCSIKAFAYLVGTNTRWRIYAVNHMASTSTFTADITGTPSSTNAYKRGTVNYVTLQNQGGSKFRIIDTLDANACQFYDAGLF